MSRVSIACCSTPWARHSLLKIIHYGTGLRGNVSCFLFNKMGVLFHIGAMPMVRCEIGNSYVKLRAYRFPTFLALSHLSSQNPLTKPYIPSKAYVYLAITRRFLLPLQTGWKSIFAGKCCASKMEKEPAGATVRNRPYQRVAVAEHSNTLVLK